MALQRPLLAAELNCCDEIGNYRTMGCQWVDTDARLGTGRLNTHCTGWGNTEGFGITPCNLSE